MMWPHTRRFERSHGDKPLLVYVWTENGIGQMLSYQDTRSVDEIYAMLFNVRCSRFLVPFKIHGVPACTKLIFVPSPCLVDLGLRYAQAYIHKVSERQSELCGGRQATCKYCETRGSTSATSLTGFISDGLRYALFSGRTGLSGRDRISAGDGGITKPSSRTLA
jgi:hypothetical protein